MFDVKCICPVPEDLCILRLNSYVHTFCNRFLLFFYLSQMRARGYTTSEAFCFPIAICLFQTGKSSKAFLINFWEQLCIDALCRKSCGALNWWCSIGRQFTADTCASQFQIFPLKVVVGIHDKNSVTERVSKSVQMLLPVRINTWK